MQTDAELVPLEKATAVFFARLLAALRDNQSMAEIERVTGLPEQEIYRLVVYATEAQ